MNNTAPDITNSGEWRALNMTEVAVSPQEMRAHMARVETMTNLLERLGEAIANSPYAAMLPADLVNDLRAGTTN